ncbi:sulfotransferase [Sphaerisporangium siamense]|uniref:LPS sulfotransferase NodH n=1 Tax=Sphaerisporangium siamense TaxID=795645 RepID=A0A7W7GDW3_9ACTN|nr:sulfotransferase [Sphaerisporangium siamense]MBB4706057.1 LPS sulfotransferase NodH [Sphaerisporangium siamense]GII88588.1 sulfotransferase [Sphaerisporangium siamense]
MRSDRPVFIIGCPRSGTTMLQLMLHAHPRIAVPPETRFLLQAYYHRRIHGDMRVPGNRRALAEWIATDKSTKFRELGVDRDAYIRKAADGPGSLGSVIGEVFRGYAERFRKPRWGDKRPSYSKHVDVVLRLFPDAQFIHLIRDGRDCVASLKEMPWFTLDVYHAIAIWAATIDHGRRHAARLPADAYHELRYEDLTADPATELAKVCAFLGEDYDPAMCEPSRVARVAVPARKVWHSNTHHAVTQARVGTWSTRLAPWEIALCEEVLGRRLRAYGYDVPGGSGASVRHLLAYRRTAARRALSRAEQVARDRVNRMREPGPLAAMLTSGQLSHVGVPRPRAASSRLVDR